MNISEEILQTIAKSLQDRGEIGEIPEDMVTAVNSFLRNNDCPKIETTRDLECLVIAASEEWYS